MDGVGTPYTGISPPAVLTGCPLCLRRLTVFQGRFNARTEAGQSYLPDMRVIAPKPATACLCAEGCSPYTSFLKLGSWPAQSRTAFLSGAYRMYPMYLFNFQAVASPHGCTVASAFVPNGECRNVSQIEPHFPQRIKEKGGWTPPFRVDQVLRYAAIMSINWELVGACFSSAPAIKFKRLRSETTQQF